MAIGLASALPALAYSTYNQWSARPGATGRMAGGCALAGAILSVAMLAAYLAS